MVAHEIVHGSDYMLPLNYIGIIDRSSLLAIAGMFNGFVEENRCRIS